MDIVLVSMPMADVERPSIALGLLKAVLTQRGLDAKIFYGNVRYLDYFGPSAYRLSRVASPEEALVDWLFAPVAFPEHTPPAEEYLAALLRRNPHLGKVEQVKITGNLLELRRRCVEFVDWMVQAVLRQQPRIVGCTSMFQQHVASLALLRKIREQAPEVVTMIGGANCESIMGKTTHQNYRWVDYVVSGEADAYFAEFCEAVLRQGRDLPAAELPEGVFGPVHREIGYPHASYGDGVPRSITVSMAGMPAPDYDDYYQELDGSLYSRHIIPGTPIEAARGCWWGAKHHCTFCGLNGHGMDYRSKQADTVLAELDVLHKRYGTSRFEAVDNIIEMDYFNTLLPTLVESGRDFSFFFETKSNLKKSQIELMSRAGIRWIQPGIEALHSDVLKLIRKGVTAIRNVQLLKWCRQYGVRVGWNMIAGFPGEQDSWYAEIAEWLSLIEHFQPCSLVSLRYDRYSPYFNNAGAWGIELEPVEFYRFAYPLPPESLKNQVYFFSDRAARLPPYLKEGPLPGRPGLEAVRDAIGQWLDRWNNGAAMLSARRHDGVLEVTDTRSCAVQAVQHFSGLAALVLDACDGIATPRQIANFCAAAGHDAGSAAIDAAVQDLLERKLLLSLDNGLLSLVLAEPVTLLDWHLNAPSGTFSPRPVPTQIRAQIRP
ncbi:MAG TPA: RiPP maturation radical SAM C-methyltransferase [Stellaceae bacterium]|nr:RiPP maturation radical SAM C-methyltransferase [Stellaceae bacterium]